MSVRSDLVTFLRANVPADTQVYVAPPDVMKAPAVVVNPSDPYAEPFDQGGPNSVIWGFELVLVVSRAKVDESLTRLEDLAAAIWGTLNQHPNTRWVSFGDVGTTDVGEVPMLTATVSIAIADIANPI